MSGACWHCGEPLPPDPPQANVAGIPHAVCCNGCRGVAEWIAELGLADYYRLRTGAPARAPDPGESAKSAAAYLRPELSRHLLRTLADGNSEVLVLVDGMHCTACCWLIERTLGRLPGVIDVSVNAGARRARIVFDASVLPLSRIVDTLGRVGYRALPLDRNALDDTRRRETRDAQKRLAVAGLGAMQAMMYASALWFGAFDGADAVTREVFRWLTLLATTPVVFYSAAPFFAGAFRLLRARRLGMDVPVALAVALIYAGSVIEILAVGPDIWLESVSMFIFFLCAGRYLEMRARHHAGDVSDALARLTPLFADRVQPDGTLLRVGAIELVPGDRVVVGEGASVPADGTLETEHCRVDEALLCGESTPRQRRRGDALCAGSIIVGAPATVRVTRVGADTVVAGIVALTTRAAAAKPRLARAGEQAAAGLVARVLVLAAFTAIGWTIADSSHALAATVAVLVVACPCAFALAAPAAVTRALAVLTERNVLVVRPDALEDLAGVTHVIFDKTGTLTEPAIDRDRERLRPGALASVEALVREGIHVTIASGDTEARVEAVAARLGVAAWHARQSPADKLELLASLRAQGARVAVVGDGVNDAPMLAGADVAIAVGTAADAAHAASDIVITGSLEAMAQARAIARQTLSILGQNRRWAVWYNLATVPLAALGFVPPWLAAIGMSASSLAVVVNALRIGSVKEPPAEGEAIIRRRALA